MKLKKLTVFISSPIDVAEERRSARGVVEDANRDIAQKLGFTLALKMWEDFPAGFGPPLETVKVELRDCDFFLMILSRRYGSPPSASSESGSGTIEEFKTALALREQSGGERPEIAVYFKKITDRQLLEDPGPQLVNVLRFKKQMQEGYTLLYKEYSSAEGFADMFRANLTRWLLALWEKQPAKHDVLQRFFALGAPEGREPEALIVYPPLEKRPTDITHLLPYAVLEDFQAVHKITKCLNLAGCHQVHTKMVDVYQSEQEREQQNNKVFLCVRNKPGRDCLDRIEGKRFAIRNPDRDPDLRQFEWHNRHGTVLVCSPQAVYLRLQRQREPTWVSDPAKCYAVDFAVLARFPDPRSLLNPELGRLSVCFVLGLRGLGTWGAAWYLDKCYNDLVHRPKDGPEYQALLRVEYWDYRIHQVTDVSGENQRFFDNEIAQETIDHHLEQHAPPSPKRYAETL